MVFVCVCVWRGDDTGQALCYRRVGGLSRPTLIRLCGICVCVCVCGVTLVRLSVIGG